MATERSEVAHAQMHSAAAAYEDICRDCGESIKSGQLFHVFVCTGPSKGRQPTETVLAQHSSRHATQQLQRTGSGAPSSSSLSSDEEELLALEQSVLISCIVCTYEYTTGASRCPMCFTKNQESVALEEAARLKREEQERRRRQESDPLSRMRDVVSVVFSWNWAQPREQRSPPNISTSATPSSQSGAQKSGLISPRVFQHLSSFKLESSDMASVNLLGQECSICMEEFDEGDDMRSLPCCHIFHQECIDDWLTRKTLCPVCDFDLS